MTENKGAITILVIVFGSVLLILVGGLLGFVFMQLRQSAEKTAWNGSLHIAEAGIDYYKWCLNNEIEKNCAVEKNYFDASGNLAGGFSLSVDSIISCGETTQKKVISTGWTDDFPNVKRKIGILYGKTSVAKYAYILNENVWVGDDHEIRGPYHGNGGVRMDGENQSLVTSAQEDWVCTSSFGCSSCPISAGCRTQGSNCICPGVFTTANGREDLFQYPVPPFNFEGITVDLAQMKASAQSAGIYLPPSKNLHSQGKGYHLKFLSNGTVQVWIITKLSSTYAYSIEEYWHYDYFIISNEYLYNTYMPPPSCSVVFVEDNLWIEGEVKNKITIASANLINANVDTDIVLPGDIDYVLKDGSEGLALIGERNVLIGPQSPNQMELRGVFIAQKGRFSRNHYPNNYREKLEIYGSIVSSGRVGTKWTSGSQIVSGYNNRETYFDANLIYAAPPFVPTITSAFEVVSWEELFD